MATARATRSSTSVMPDCLLDFGCISIHLYTLNYVCPV
jgi:hypothetical protein